MTATIETDTSPFAMFPAQADYSNTDDEKLRALGVLASHADSTDALREVAVMLELIDPPTPKEDDTPPAPVFCEYGHNQDDHGRVAANGRPYCHACIMVRVHQTDSTNPAGTRRRLRHLLLNGFTLRYLAKQWGTSAQSLSRITSGAVTSIPKQRAEQVREFFDKHRDDFYTVAWNDRTRATRINWVWAELYEDIDDPECEPVLPGQVAA